jgi:hypothetical protein
MIVGFVIKTLGHQVVDKRGVNPMLIGGFKKEFYVLKDLVEHF